MASGSVVDYYSSRANLDKLNPLIRSAYNTTSDFEEYKQKLLTKVDAGNQDGNTSYLDSLEEIRREQRARLAQIEHEYYNLKNVQSFDVPYYSQNIEQKHVTIVTSKPPLPTASRRSPSPVFVTEDQTQHHIHHRPISANIVRRHDDNIAYCPHRTSADDTITKNEHDLSTSHVQNQIHNLWNEFELEDYLEQKKTRRPPSAPLNDNWAGRVTVPEPFCLTNSMSVDNIHRRKCMHEIEAAKIQKEVDDELLLNRSFKANPVPAHVRMPLYEQLQDEQRVRREQVRHMTKEYLNSISKPFGFESREKAKINCRRHSYSGKDTPRRQPQFKAKPVPDFYYRTSKDIEEMKENSLYRSIKKQIRAKELLRQSRLPSSMQEREHHVKHHTHRSMSAENLARAGREEYTFKPKTNGHYIPNYDKLHEKFLRETERAKRLRPPTKCEPFLLYTNMIPSRKDRVLDDIRNDEETRYLQTFQIKGKQLPPRSASGISLSASLQQPEAIPTKTTDIQQVRERIGKKKRRDEELRNKFEEKFQRSRSAKEKHLRERIYERAKSQDKSAIYKAKKEENIRKIRQSMRRSEDEYAKKLDEMNHRIDRRPLLIEQHPGDAAVRHLEKKIQHAMNVAKITERDLMRERFNPPNVKVTKTRTVYSS
ncbi:unnamed protein product [Adineta steineri]|uniref:Uncharacterized protein n=2 Tax=Adineta steineri TaxID=433720 RepID=A0A813N5S6_9BILA|nr:unnamed protein product [Adineta steineri]